MRIERTGKGLHPLAYLRVCQGIRQLAQLSSRGRLRQLYCHAAVGVGGQRLDVLDLLVGGNASRVRESWSARFRLAARACRWSGASLRAALTQEHELCWQRHRSDLTCVDVGRMLSSSSIRMQFWQEASDSTSRSLKRPGRQGGAGRDRRRRLGAGRGGAGSTGQRQQ